MTSTKLPFIFICCKSHSFYHFTIRSRLSKIFICSSRGLLILIINLGLRSPVSTSSLFHAFKRLWNLSQITSDSTLQGAGMLLCHYVLGQLTRIFFTLKKIPKTLTMRVFELLCLFFIFILGVILTQDAMRRKQYQEAQGKKWT